MATISNFRAFRLQGSLEPEYFECLVTEIKELNDGVSHEAYVNLHKDPRITTIEFKIPPDEKKLSEDEFKIKTVEYNSFVNRKDLQMPTWHLHVSTVRKLLKELEI